MVRLRSPTHSGYAHQPIDKLTPSYNRSMVSVVDTTVAELVEALNFNIGFVQ